MIQDRQKLYHSLIAAYRKTFRADPPIDGAPSMEVAISSLTRAVFTGIPLKPGTPHKAHREQK